MATQQIPGLTRTDLQHHDLSVPGVTLPGPPSAWERIYNPPRPKLNE